MKTLFLIGWWLILCISLINAFTPAINFGGNRFGNFRSSNEPKMTYKYDRVDEVKKECSSILPPSSKPRPYGKTLYNLKEQMSFINGDWWQDLDKAPLMPFDDKSNGSLDHRSPLSLISFWVTDVDRAHRSKYSVSISGVLQMGITMGGLFGLKPYEGNPGFLIYPSHSELVISFQGIFTETEENGGESILCLLGNTMLPYRYSDSNNPWDWVKEPGYINQPPLIQDERILLVLRYPKTFTLTKRAIHGSLKSLNPKSSQKYFDEVHISASLSISANYEFTSQMLVSKACTPYPYNDSLANTGFDVYKGADFCQILERFTGQDPLTIVPHWRCNGTNEFCSQLGPFETDARIRATNGSFKGVNLIFQDVRCEEVASKDKVNGFTKVAAVVRVVPPLENHYRTAQRTGLNNMTLSAEGMWKSSSGQLCMVGCRGIVDDEDSSLCDSRVCLYVPLSFSIKQRSIILGTISSVKESNTSFFPLTFEKLIRPTELYDQYSVSRPYYKYSKIQLAGTVLDKHEPFSFGAVIKKSFLTFPRVEDSNSFLVGLSLLSEDLTLHLQAVPDYVPSHIPSRTDVQLEILSLGPLFGRYWSLQNDSITEEDNPYRFKTKYTERQLLLNVSAQLSLTGKQYDNFSTLFVEGLYYPLVGKMYLIGCRDVRASWKLLYESMDLEAGLDCLIEVVVSYPPTTARWLVNPTAKVSVSSQRNEDDPLFFKPIKLQTVPLMYRAQREDILSRRGVEGILQVLTLSVAIGCILSQLFYIKDNLDSVPYISLVMVAVQALGYGLPLITGAEALFKKSESYENSSFVLEKSQMIRVIDYTVKVLVLVSFSLTLRLYQKVWRSRIRLLTRAPLEPRRVPSDRQVFIVTLIIHVIGVACVLMVHKLQAWETELEEYVGLVQDFFLLPQVIANLIWQINCKPLRKLYFMGITVIRLLPHIYDYMRSPIPNPYFAEDYEFVDPHLDFYSKFGDIAIPATAVSLAIAVYVQQKWDYEKLSQFLTFGKFKVLPCGSRAYEPLPSVVAEAELASGVNGDAATRRELDVE